MSVEIKTAPTVRRRGTLNRAEILAVASEQFRSKGYDGTTLADVATALSVTKPVLYYHFSSKEDILLGCVENACGALDEGLAAEDSVTLSGRRRLEIFLKLYLEVISNNFGITLVLSDDRMMSDAGREEYQRRRRKISKHVTAVVKQGMDDGSLVKGDLTLTTYAIFGMFNWVSRWKSQKPDISIDQVYAEFAPILFRGIGAP